ncbi:class I SAM-dependent methyltransferase [Mesobacillus zeae]|uniref:Protein-L-IsoD(D-D) O-methyltransferase n=1 Tax=Mesobacillus zeae TaxID=1917180 RepID=A0A398B420_9BACI|nr:class I SAM-dependent methyltransferase [Mesobacillus zeae]RID84154.1 hypothetical protein D1970_13620 [Mesobacillus zeae]
MIVTTGGRTDDETVLLAKETAAILNAKYVSRRKRSVLDLMQSENDDCIVRGRARIELYPFGESKPFFFHPNSAMFRIKRLIKGECDPLTEAARLEPGMSFLDCTLGLGSDSIVAAFAAGPTGQVIGVESNPYLAYIVRDGLIHWKSGLAEMDSAMNAIRVFQSNSLTLLKGMGDNSIDCVYFDPMFEETILESDGIRGLARFADYSGLSSRVLEEAYRVAKKRVLLKDHFRSERFSEFAFKVFKRKSAKFHFGVIEKD